MQKLLYRLGVLSVCGLALSACSLGEDDSSSLDPKKMAKLLPSHVKNPQSWATDIHDIMNELRINKTANNVCSIVAIVDQESNFHADPEVAGLGEKSLKEINHRLEDKLGKTLADYYRTMLQTKPTPKDSFINRIRKVKTERQLDELYREIFDYFAKHYNVSAITGAAKLVGSDLSERMNPITTLGSMQVHIDYAKAHKRTPMSTENLRKDLYSQYGGLYYGIHRLMKYEALYPKAIYRFADYNSGVYSSRNASFQKMLATVTGKNVTLDGDLLLYEKGGDVRAEKSSTEKLINQLFAKKKIQHTERQVRFDLKREKEKGFEDTLTYKHLKQLYLDKTGKQAPYAIMPEVVITGPKLSRDYNTNWFATRVDARYQTCMAKAKQLRYK